MAPFPQWTDPAEPDLSSVSVGDSWSKRSYEYTVEPAYIQALDPTAFLLVDRLARRIAAADCYPGIAVVPRVSGRPLAISGSEHD